MDNGFPALLLSQSRIEDFVATSDRLNKEGEHPLGSGRAHRQRIMLTTGKHERIVAIMMNL